VRILVSGVSGLVGRAVARALASDHEVGRLVRTEARAPGEVLWDWVGRRFDSAAAEGCDAVVHLAGENLGSGRWTEERKRRIRDSRVEGTGFLATSLAALQRPPRVFVAASAVGFYGDTGEAIADERSPAGRGFLAEVCRDWEAAASPLAQQGVRVVWLRFGLVLSPEGGALGRMLPVFRLGLGGPVGSGRQWMSWIALEDVVRVVSWVLAEESVRGPVNVVAPEPVRNRDFARVLGRAVRRPVVLRVPAIALRLLLGEMAEALLLASSRVVPRVLSSQGFEFRFARLDEALVALVGSRP
jgi:hypothetical protein